MMTLSPRCRVLMSRESPELLEMVPFSLLWLTTMIRFAIPESRETAPPTPRLSDSSLAIIMMSENTPLLLVWWSSVRLRVV